MVEDETGHLTWDIYGVPLSDVVFETEKTPRGAVRCVAFGNLIAIAGIKSISPTPSCTFVGSRKACRVPIPSVATKCGPCASCSGSRIPSRRSCSRQRAGVAVHDGRLCAHGGARWCRGQARLSGSSSHAAPRLWLCAGQQGPRYASVAGLPRPPQHPAHGAIHRVVAGQVQGFLEVSRDLSRKVRGIPQPVPSLGSGRQTHAATSDRGYGRLPCLARAE